MPHFKILPGGGQRLWVPNDIISDISSGDYRAWWDAADLSTITDAGGGAVSQLDDKSPNGRDLSQATSGHRPITGTRTINGLNTLDFDGSNDNLFDDTALASNVINYACVVEPDDTGNDGNLTNGQNNDRGNAQFDFSAGTDGVKFWNGALISKYSITITGANLWSYRAGGSGYIRKMVLPKFLETQGRDQ